jgi:hypothetical protein
MTVDPFPELRAADDLADTSRFTIIPVPDEAGLAGQVRPVVEHATGRRWFAKAAAAEFDAANEVICARLAQPLRLARPQATFVAGRGDLVLIQHVADHPDEGELLAAGVDIAGEPSCSAQTRPRWAGSPRTWPTRPAWSTSCCLRSWSTTTTPATTATGWC